MTDQKEAKAEKFVREVEEWTVGSMAIRVSPKDNPAAANDVRHIAAALDKYDMQQVDVWKAKFYEDTKNQPPVKDHETIIRHLQEWGSAAAVEDIKQAFRAQDEQRRDDALRLTDTACEDVGAHVLGHDKPPGTPAMPKPTAPKVGK